MDRPIGSKAKLNGKDVVWSGSDYGWQSPASHLKLRNQGQFAIGRKELDAVGRFLAPGLQKIKDFQQKFREATPFLDPVERTVNRAVGADDRLPSSRVAQGGAIAAQRAAQAANIDPRVGMLAPLMVGLVKADGTFGYKPGGANKKLYEPHVKAIEERIEAAHQHYKNKGTLKGFDLKIADTPDGGSIVIKDQGTKNFDKRSGISASYKPPKPAAQKAKAAAGVAPAPKPTVEVAPAKPQLTIKSSDPELRFKPTDKESSGISSGQRRKKDDLLIRNPILPRDLEPSVTTPPVSSGALAVGAQGPAVRGTALAGERYANAHLSQGSNPFKVKETQAHHEVPLKDAADFLEGMSPEQVNAVRSQAEKLGLYFGDTQLNTLYPRQPYHQGNQAWPQAFEQAAHPNLQNPARPLEAKSGTSRWAQFTPEQKLEMLPEFLQDAIEGRRIGQNAVFQQNLLQTGNAAYINPFGGNLSQAVLAPESLAALKIISEKRRNARQSLRIQ